MPRDLENLKRWRNANRDKQHNADKRYRERHPDKVHDKEVRRWKNNRTIESARNKAYRKTNAAKLRIKRRQRIVLALYNLTPQQHNDLLKNQNYRCAFLHCGEAVDTSSPIDHCHVSGKVRGILCQKHNIGLGYFDKRSPECLLDAYQYLKSKQG
jgi:hypothetical protein